MQRPRKHQIDTEACNALRTIVPSSSVIREIEYDYGLDFQVELFNESKSTGKMFYLQLKGTDKDITDDKVSYQLETKHIEYYSSIGEPVLFVIYSTQTSQFWAVWANKLKSIYSAKSLSQKTIKITLDIRNLIDKSFFISLEKSFDSDIPNKVNITFSSTIQIEQKLKEQIIKWLNHYYNQYIEFENYLLPKSVHFDISTRSINELKINIKENNITIDNVIVYIKNKNFLFFPVITPSQPPEQLNHILILISSIFYKYNLKNSIEILINNLFDYNPNPNFIIDLVEECIRLNQIFDLRRLTHTAIANKNLSVTQLINICLIAFDEHGDFSELYQENLTKFIDTHGDNESKGISYYNLANSYMMNSKFYLASKYYQKARKHEPKYLEKAYWWREYGSALFLSGHYYFAEGCYRKCIALDINFDKPLIFALTGDTLFHQGKFSEAKCEYEHYIRIAEPCSYYYEIALKINVCDFLISNQLDNIKHNQVNSEERLANALEDSNSPNFKTLLQSAINIHPLNGLAWFNYAVYQSQEKNSDLAYMLFLVTGFMQEWDFEAWKNCLWEGINSKKDIETSIIIEIILRKFGNEALNSISEDILNQPNFDENQKHNLIEFFSKIPEHIDYQTPHAVTIR